jgi:acyl-CoA synthetase
VIAVDKLEPARHELSLSQILANTPPLAQAIATKSDDLAALLFTSGTEGHLKG